MEKNPFFSTTISKIKSPFFVCNYFIPMEMNKILNKNLHTAQSPVVE